MDPIAPTLTRSHHQRLREIYRSAGWPCHDMLEVELLAAGLLERRPSPEGFESLRVTDAGIRRLAEVFAHNKAVRSPHEALVERVLDADFGCAVQPEAEGARCSGRRRHHGRALGAFARQPIRPYQVHHMLGHHGFHAGGGLTLQVQHGFHRLHFHPRAGELQPARADARHQPAHDGAQPVGHAAQ
eukprot:gene58803-78459_t